MEEWSCQATLEKHFRLPATVHPPPVVSGGGGKGGRDPVGQAKSQVWFITHFAKPLLDLTVRAVPRELVTFLSLFVFCFFC
jgi:hypothetical protein